MISSSKKRISPYPLFALSTLSFLYGQIIKKRNYFYDTGVFRTYAPLFPTISVGNVSLGGSGKTPLCIFIVGELKSQGLLPVILTRGYGGKIIGPYQLSGNENVTEVGDEVLMLFEKANVPVIISRDRVRGQEFIKFKDLGNVVLLDDGFQHRRLGRTLDILSFYVGNNEAVEDLVKGRLLPLGSLREPIQDALRRTDIVILSFRRPARENEELDDKLLKLISPEMPIFKSYIEPKGVYSLREGETLLTKVIVAFCGIANPQGFYQTLGDMGYSIKGNHYFPDHHNYHQSELLKLQSDYPRLPLVCTEKDEVKLRGMDLKNIFVLKTETKILPQDVFIREILKRVSCQD